MSYDRQPMPPQVALTSCGGLPKPRHRRLDIGVFGVCAGAAPSEPTMKACGTVVTLALPGPDGALLHEALSCLRKGDVLAIDRLGDTLHAAVGAWSPPLRWPGGLPGSSSMVRSRIFAKSSKQDFRSGRAVCPPNDTPSGPWRAVQCGGEYWRCRRAPR
jgi:hypothetical protein